MKRQAKDQAQTSRRAFLKGILGGAVAVGGGGVVGGMPGFVGRARAAAKSAIIIGNQEDLTGSTASWGYWHAKAARAAIAKINREGGIAGREVVYVEEDTESNPSVGPRKFRKLVQQHDADFILGPQYSPVVTASNPLARELNTLYFPVGMAAEITTEKGNRYVFRIGTHARMQAEVAYRWVLENLGKKWTVVVTSISWGQSHAHEWSTRAKAAGGTVLDTITIPIGTDDFTPYLLKVPAATEVLLHVFWAEEEIKFLQQSTTLGLHKRFKRFAPFCTVEAISTDKFKEAVSGTWFVSYLPRLFDQIPDDLKPYNRTVRQMVGIDDNGDEAGNTGRTSLSSHYWLKWETLHLLKRAIEQTGWKSKKNSPDLIKTLEGASAKASVEFPQGDLYMRPEDHQGFHDHFISHVEDGKERLKFRIDKKLAMYPIPRDYSKEPFAG